jgi:hypothetical protein
MTDKTEIDNPQAFPCVNSNYDGNWDRQPTIKGMTLRDYFAGKALSSMLSEPQKITDETYNEAAKLSYKFADAMLKERSYDR